MSSDRITRKVVVVTGDITIDWNLARSRGPEAKGPAWLQDVCSHVSWQRGGAALLAALIEAVAAPVGYEVRRPLVPFEIEDQIAPPVHPEDRAYHHCYASWMQYPYTTKKDNKEKPSWRIHEFLGINRCDKIPPPGDWARVRNDDPDAELVFLDDAALGFNQTEALWPEAITRMDSKPWVLLKLTRIGDGTLWDYLVERHSERLIVVIAANDFRHREAQISRELSWERTAQDLAWELTFNPRFSKFARCAHVIVSFNAAGSIIYSRAAEPDVPPTCSLVFDPTVIEGEWERAREGRMMGYTSCLATGIVKELLSAPDKPDFESGVKRGLAAIRKLHSEGYGTRGEATHTVKLTFPLQAVSDEIAKETKDSVFSSVNVRLPGLIRKTGTEQEVGRPWTILEEAYPSDAFEIAKQVIEVGLEEALKKAPCGKFGKLATVDRQEIESLRTIGALVSEYADAPKPKRPLSIAVFGPPGAGKSFGIKQLAMSLRPDEIEVREFNMSQFQTTAELISALHQVRDIGLSHKLPLIFWDEFDSSLGETPYAWLRHFLAPMQDGQFQEGDVTHPIGRAIFVFAGGTSPRYQEFGKEKNEDEKQLYKRLKVPDFISRLKGFLNVLGPNPVYSPARDPFYVLRRAILLRSMLSDVPEIVKDKVPQIDPGVLCAFLTTREYRHGARSMETIVATSRLSGKNKFERSSLPPEDQLELHVDAKDFIGKIQKLELTDEILTRLAKAAHQLFCEELEKKGWKYGGQLDVKNKLHPNLKPWSELTDEICGQNRGQVEDIPAKLAYAGCNMVPDRIGAARRKFPSAILEELAASEHARWMRHKIAAGWRYGNPRNDDLKLHPCLLAWSEEDRPNHAAYAESLGPGILLEEEKPKDREAVQSIPDILSLAGFRIVWPDEKK
jgi:hypothetical protein